MARRSPLRAGLRSPRSRQAQEQLCRGSSRRRLPTQAEKELADLESWAAQRAEFGFRHDIPYVRELVRRGVWEYDVGYIPVTPRENVYLKLRDKLELGTQGEPLPAPPSRRRRRRSRCEDDWPREPYLLLSSHEATSRSTSPRSSGSRAIRTTCGPSASATASASCSGSRTGSGTTQKQLERAGFYLSSTGSGNAANRVRRRPVHRAHGRRRLLPQALRRGGQGRPSGRGGAVLAPMRRVGLVHDQSGRARASCWASAAGKSRSASRSRSSRTGSRSARSSASTTARRTGRRTTDAAARRPSTAASARARWSTRRAAGACDRSARAPAIRRATRRAPR